MRRRRTEGRGKGLLERDRELEAMRDALVAARAGEGGVVLVEGPAGIGKSELLRAAGEMAGELGLRVLWAWGGELERSFPYGIARQLLEPAVEAASAADRAELLTGAAAHAAGLVDPRAPIAAGGAPAGDASILAHGLYWLSANLAARQPLLLVVDDLHWGDPASVGWLVYLARRIDGLPVAIVGGVRPVEPGSQPGLVDPLRELALARQVRPAALSVGAVEAFAREVLGSRVEARFVAAVHAATAGNPFYLTELLRALAGDGVAGVGDDVAIVERAGPEAVAHTALARLGRLPAEHLSVARAIAVLQPHAELRHVAKLANIDDDAAAHAADTLLAIGMLRSIDPCELSHPILRAAIENELPPARRGLAHATAARLLAADDAPAGIVASHMMHSTPAGDPGTVAILRHAASDALARGAPAGAAEYLARAVAEPPRPEQRIEVLLELGTAQSLAQQPDGIAHLREALDAASEPRQVAAIAVALGQALGYAGELEAAYTLARDTADRLKRGEDRPILELESFLLAVAMPAGHVLDVTERAQALAARLPPDSPAAGPLYANIGFHALLAGQPRADVQVLIDRALQLNWGLEAVPFGGGRDLPAMALAWLDELDRADALLAELIAVERNRGSLRAVVLLSGWRAFCLQRRGDLARAEADIEQAFAAESSPEVAIGQLVALFANVRLLIDRGQPAQAAALAAAAPVPPAFESQPAVIQLRHAQAAALLEQRQFAEAARILTHVGDGLTRTGAVSPAIGAWRSDLALALAGLGRHDDALHYAQQELALSEQADIDRARGIAHRTLGLLQPGETGMRHLHQAAAALEHSPSRLEHARALIELGAALRRTNRRNEAREQLQHGLEIAHRRGGTALVNRARDELATLGVRPRSLLLTGVDALTASEARVAHMAADGMTNRDIAQALFITLKTVEKHLHNTYDKLAIGSRAQLPDALRTEHATTDA